MRPAQSLLVLAKPWWMLLTTIVLVVHVPNSLLSSSLLPGVTGMETESGNTAECGLFLAVSSTATAEKSTWGIYAGQTIPAQERIGYPEIGINIPHLKANSIFTEIEKKKTPDGNSENDDDDNENDETSNLLTRTVDFLEEVIWVAGPVGAAFELGQGKSVAAIPGAGALSAFQAQFTNADWNASAAYHRIGLGETPGVNHPNRGAVSPFYQVTLQSKSEIAAGAEIFMDYGENWVQQETQDDLTAEDYVKLDQTIDDMIEFFAKYADTMDDASKLQVYHFITKDVLKAAVGEGKAKRISAILPARPNYLYQVKEAGGALKFSKPAIHRSIDWLKQFGRCMDNIAPGASTIPNAGRGAFATRAIPEGASVAPLPLVHVPFRDIFNMHELTQTEEGDYIRESNQVKHQQLLLNYVYGHPQSTMAFYPVGAVASFINHHDEPNAKLVWSDHPNNAKEWFQLEPEELLEPEYAYMGLMMEIVALRDIVPGEEIFLDYGPEWKEAWNQHVQRWEARVQAGELPSPWPLRAISFNDEYRNKPFKTPEELKAEPYPENVVLKAFLTILETTTQGTVEDPSPWGAVEGVNTFSVDNLRDCIILSRQETSIDGSVPPYNYTVSWTSKRGKELVVKDVPHGAFVFVDAPETSDQFVEGSFRHYIGIPDDVFPQGPWRNLNPTTTEAEDAVEASEE